MKYLDEYKRNVKISASIMCADLLNLEKEYYRLILSGIDRIHYDVMDGVFVNNIELGFSLLGQLEEISEIPVECHLMTVNPENKVEILLKHNVEYICFHPEQAKKTENLIERIKEERKKAGIVINPDTELKQIVPLIKDLDFIIFMTVYPGFAGQPFKPQALKKIHEIKKIIETENYKVELGADGALSEKTIPDVLKSGVENLILGSSSLFKVKGNYKNYKKTISKIRKLARQQNCLAEF